jgi:hypothetical protein
MCGCSGTSVTMSSRFMFNKNNTRMTMTRLNNRGFRNAVPVKVSHREKVRKTSFTKKKGGLRTFYFSY